MSLNEAPWEGKWKAHDATRHPDPPTPNDPERTGLFRLPTGKAWMLRWAWFISTGMLFLGAILIVIVLAGYGHHLGI